MCHGVLPSDEYKPDSWTTKTHTDGIAQDERIKVNVNGSWLSLAIFQQQILLVYDSGDIGNVHSAIRTTGDDEFVSGKDRSMANIADRARRTVRDEGKARRIFAKSHRHHMRQIDCR